MILVERTDQPKEEWCVGPEGTLPQADQFIAQLLHLRHDPKALRKTANVFPSRGPIPRDTERFARFERLQRSRL